MLPFATEPDRFMGARFRQSTSIAGCDARPTSSAAFEVSWQKSSLEMPRCESSLSRVCEAGGRGSVRSWRNARWWGIKWSARRLCALAARRADAARARMSSRGGGARGAWLGGDWRARARAGGVPDESWRSSSWTELMARWDFAEATVTTAIAGPSVYHQARCSKKGRQKSTLLERA